MPFNSELPKLPSGVLCITFGSFKNKEEIFKILRLDCEANEEEIMEKYIGNYNGLEVGIDDKCE